MTAKTYPVELTEAEIAHLVSYCQWWENGAHGGWYYGPRKQFEDRHMRIREKLAKAQPSTSGGSHG